MTALNQIAEARASALSLRASAKACGTEQGALKFRLMRAAESSDAVVLIAVRGIDCIKQLESALRLTVAALEGKPCRQQTLDDSRAVLAGAGCVMSKPINSLTIAEASDLNAKDRELILRALDALDRLVQAELANKQDAAAGETRSRILIVRAKLLTMQGGAQ